MEQQYKESNFRFTDPIRFFKANDPYYFEVDNIPLKQLQENCLWLKDQVRKDTSKLLGVKRVDIDELRPYATGSDRLVRVKPGRYTSRINDASNRTPLAYLEKVMGQAVGDVDAYQAAVPAPDATKSIKNAALEDALERFKSTLSQDALGMNGLIERAFTWPVVNSDTPVSNTGTNIDRGKNWLSHGGLDVNILGSGAGKAPFPITEAITWARSPGNQDRNFILPTFEITSTNSGFAKLPLTESYFIKAWRGVSRLAIVDIDDEISVEVPQFDADDFSYMDEDGNSVAVEGVQQRIDLVFIYSKPIDASAVNTIQNGEVTKITKPALGIVKGAGIKPSFRNSNVDLAAGFQLNSEDSIMAAPGDQGNPNIGFNSTSANDIAFDMNGSFPAPDDILNLAPLISQNLEDNAYELIGQSILPVAYVFVQESSQVVLATDVVDIRPLFRTAELTYNERAGVGAAFPQLSLANPAVGKAQMDHELKRVKDTLDARIDFVVKVGDTQTSMNTVAAGYVFGGFNFGPEGALFDYYQRTFAGDTNDSNDSVAYIKEYVKGKYGFGSESAAINIPDYPDWDLAQWCVETDLEAKGLHPNDYINTFFSLTAEFDNPDPSVVAGSYKEQVNAAGFTPEGTRAKRLSNFSNTRVGTVNNGVGSKVNFHYVSKRIKFNRPDWLGDYIVDVGLVNSLAQNNVGTWQNGPTQGSYFGCWVEKGFDEFTIYVAFNAPGNTTYGSSTLPRFPAPHSDRYTTSGKKKKTTRTLNLTERGGERFSGFVVPVSDILYSNTDPISNAGGRGYVGNPRIGKCTYPTVSWKMTAVPRDDSEFFYGNLNNTNPTITLKQFG